MMSKEETAPLHYQIRIEGRLDRRWAAWFEGMELSVEDGEDSAVTTLIAGPIADQAALHGLLSRVRDLRLPLVSVQRVEGH